MAALRREKNGRYPLNMTLGGLQSWPTLVTVATTLSWLSHLQTEARELQGDFNKFKTVFAMSDHEIRKRFCKNTKIKLWTTAFSSVNIIGFNEWAIVVSERILKGHSLRSNQLRHPLQRPTRDVTYEASVEGITPECRKTPARCKI